MATENEIALVEWLRGEGGYVHEGLDLFRTNSQRKDRGVVASVNIRQNEQLLLIPEKCTLYFPDAQKMGVHEADAPCDSQLLEALGSVAESSNLSPFLLSVLLFMGEASAGNLSTHAPYFRTLPVQSPPSLLSWTAEEIELLAGTSLGRNDDAGMFERAYRDQLLPVIQQRSDLWPLEHCSLEKARTAAVLVQSRAFHMKEENWITNTVHEGTTLYLIPAIDMINHSHKAEAINTELSKCKDKLTVQLESGKEVVVDGYFAMKAERDIAAGEEILHSYGDLGDAALLRIYGFVTSDPVPNPNSFLVLPYGVIKAGIQSVVNKHEWPVTNIEQRETLVAGYLQIENGQIQDVEFHLTSESLLPEKLLTAVQVLLLPDDDFKELLQDGDYSIGDQMPFEVGLESMIGSAWTDMVLTAFVEMMVALNERLGRSMALCQSARSGSRRQNCVDLAEAVIKGEGTVLEEFLQIIVGTMDDLEMAEDECSDDE